MIKVGILLNSTTCSKYLYHTVSELAKSEQVELYYLLNNNNAEPEGLWEKIYTEINTKGFSRFFAHMVFKVISFIEFRSLAQFYEIVREHAQTHSLEEFDHEIICLTPNFSDSKLLVRYDAEDINKIKALDLDIIIRGNSSGIFKGEILHSAKEGIISFHHGDNRWNRGGPPAFWEVYRRKPSTGFVIQILSADLDGGNVLFRGNFSTSRTYTENKVTLYKVSNPYLGKLILNYADNRKLPVTEKKLPYDGQLLKIPSISKSLNYFFRTTFMLAKDAVHKMLNKHERWGVAFQARSWRYAVLRKGTIIKNPPGRFFADPFIITRNGRTVCFLEDYSYVQKRGCITAVEIFDDKNYNILGPVIEESFHMSFPYLFSFQQDLYMLPETSANNTLHIYKCVHFPMHWEYVKDIQQDCFTVDSMIFEYKDRWWLLTNNATKNETEVSATLSAYYSDNPLSDSWTPHEKNPLVLDSMRARNGGLLNSGGELPVRVRQKQGLNTYGKGMSLAQITKLSPSEFEEEKIGQISPHFFPGITKCHHLYSNGKYTVYDFARPQYLKKT